MSKKLPKLDDVPPGYLMSEERKCKSQEPARPKFQAHAEHRSVVITFDDGRGGCWGSKAIARGPEAAATTLALDCLKAVQAINENPRSVGRTHKSVRLSHIIKELEALIANQPDHCPNCDRPFP